MTDRRSPDAVTLVLSSQRSGSTLLCRDIESLGGLGDPRERLLSLQRGSGVASEADVVERIARGATEEAPEVGAVKLMVGQAPAVATAVTRRTPRGQADAMRAVVEWATSRFDRVLLVVLVRNAVDQAISRVVATSTDVFHATDAEQARAASLSLAPAEVLNPRILDQLQRVLGQRRVLTEIAADYADRALLLGYGDLTGAVEETTARLVAHARAHGFHPRRSQVSRTLVKVLDAERSQELRESFLDYLRAETGLGEADATARGA
jgi:hypothetical protein